MTTLTKRPPRAVALDSSMTLRFVVAIILSTVSGLMLLLAFPPYGFWPLVWFALVPALYAQHRLLPLKWSSLAQAVTLGVWLGPYLARLFGDELGFFFKYLGVWIAILIFFASKERRFHELTGYRWFVWQGVFNWVGFEMIRATFIPLVATSGFIGYTQATQSWLIQPVSIFGVYGINLMIMLVNFSLAQAVITWLDGRWRVEDAVSFDKRTTYRWLGVTGLLLVVWIGLSLVLYNRVPVDAPTVRVATIQPNYDVPSFQDDVNTDQVRLNAFMSEARAAAAQGAEIIFTPEFVFNFDPQEKYTAELRALAAETNAYLFLSYLVTDNDSWRNEAVLLTPSGDFEAIYGKNHVFGERPTPSAGVFPVYDTPLGRFATLICHDANYTDITRQLKQNGAQLVAMPFFEFGGFGEQLWTNVVFRAVENRVAAVVTGSFSVSGVVDAYGRVIDLAINREGQQVTLISDVPLATSDSLYTSLGDWLGWISLVGFVLFVVYQIVAERKAKREATAV